MVTWELQCQCPASLVPGCSSAAYLTSSSSSAVWASGGLLEALSAVTEIVKRDSMAWFIKGSSKFKKTFQATLLPKLDFFMFFTLILGDNVFIINLVNCVRNESC